MARELVAYTWCDVCQNLDDPTNEPAQTFTVSDLAVDLCEVHRKEFLEPLEQLLVAHGRKADLVGGKAATFAEKKRQAVGRPRRAVVDEVGPPYVCQVPGCGYAKEDGGTRTQLTSHLRRVHHLSIPQYREVLAGAREVVVVEAMPPAADLVCPECGKDFSDPEHYTVPTRAIAVHRARSHGVRSARYTEQEVTE